MRNLAPRVFGVVLFSLFFYPVSAGAVETTMFVTAYHAVRAETGPHPNVTASGARSNPHIVAAISPALRRVFSFGTIVQVHVSKAVPQPRKCDITAVAHVVGKYRIVLDLKSPTAPKGLDVLFPKDRKVLVNGKLINAADALGKCIVPVSPVGHVDPHGDLPSTQAEVAAIVRKQQTIKQISMYFREKKTPFGASLFFYTKEIPRPTCGRGFAFILGR